MLLLGLQHTFAMFGATVLGADHHRAGCLHYPAVRGPRDPALPPDHQGQGSGVSGVLLCFPGRVCDGRAETWRTGLPTSKCCPTPAAAWWRRVLSTSCSGRADQGIRGQAGDALFPAGGDGADHHRDRADPRPHRQSRVQARTGCSPLSRWRSSWSATSGARA